MKKGIRALAMLAAAMMVFAPAALAEESVISMSGTLQPAEIEVITAPMTGSVIECVAEAGDLLKAGSTMLMIDTVRVYAPCDGMVAGLRAEEGDSLTAVQAIYGAAMYVEPESEYVISASTTNAYDSNENRMIHVGETVYLTSVNNSSRTGVGLITSVTGENYTVEVMESNIRLNETCRVSRDEGSDETKGRIGQGKTQRNNPVAIQAEGSVVKLHVREGDEVKKGDLLMELAPDMQAEKPVSAVKAEKDCIMLNVMASEGGVVQKGQPVAQVFEAGRLCAVVQACEDDLLGLEVGGEVIVTLDIDPEEYMYEGVIEKISYVPVETLTGAAYEVTVSFENDKFVRMGMSVTVETAE